MKTDENGWNSFETQHTQHVLGLKRELLPLTVHNRGSVEDECLCNVPSNEASENPVNQKGELDSILVKLLQQAMLRIL